MAKTWFLASTMNLLHPMFDDNKSSLPFPFNPSNQRIVCILPESIRYGFAGSPQFSNVIREWKSAKRSLMYFDEDFKRFSSFSPLFSSSSIEIRVLLLFFQHRFHLHKARSGAYTRVFLDLTHTLLRFNSLCCCVIHFSLTRNSA